MKNIAKNTLVDLFENSVAKFPDNPFLLEKNGNEWIETTYKQTQKQVYRFGAGLIEIGVCQKDNIALLSEGRNSWIIGELAMFYAGAVNVPLSVKLEEKNDLLFRLQHSDSRYILVSANQLPKIRAIKDELPLLRQIIVFDSSVQLQEREMTMEQVCLAGDKRLQRDREGFLKIGRSLTNDDTATITYTSGTTADPKGIMLTHRNYTANVEQALTLTDVQENWRTLIILPLDHCFAHVVGFYIFMHRGAAIATVQTGRTALETLKNIPVNLKEIQPDMLLSVPALAKSFKKAIESGIKAKGNRIEKLFEFALNVSYRYNKEGWNKGTGGTFVLKPLVAIFDKILFSNIRKSFCQNLKFFIGGGALLDKDLQDFYYAIGIPMFQGYGLSEATPVISSNTPEVHKFGSSGILVKPLELSIKDMNGRVLPQGEKGEIVIHGENVMAGYWKNETATQETVRQGWLHTGDLGYMDKDGFLVVLGRYKSLLIGSDGEKYSPEGIEEALVSHSPYIDQILLYNNQNAYTSALIVPNKENLKRKCKFDWGSQDAKQEALRLIQNSISEFKGQGSQAGKFPERWLPVTFAVLEEPFSEQNQMINSTMKMVRPKIEKHYKQRIEHLYTAEGKNIYHQTNVTALK
ncbi:MAG: AMP-dependent synthetase/ligase [Bacteroidales bacterium]